MKIKLLFQPDYGATSICDKEGAYYENYDELPLSLELKKELEIFDESIWEFISGITAQRQREIYENGLRLFNLVKLELGDDYEVIELLDWIKP